MFFLMIIAEVKTGTNKTNTYLSKIDDFIKDYMRKHLRKARKPRKAEKREE